MLKPLLSTLRVSSPLRQSSVQGFFQPTMTRVKRHRHSQANNSFKKRKTKLLKETFEGSHDEVLRTDVKALQAREASDQGPTVASSLPERWSEIEVRISELSSTGDGIGFAENPNHVYVVPFSLPGEVVKAKVVRNIVDDGYSETDFIEILQPSASRDNARAKCSYFTKCSGCQFQMLSYADQLSHKKQVIEKAYKNFSGLTPEAIPINGDVVGSPLEYGYRTKLTPHFPKPRKNKVSEDESKPLETPPIGFYQKGRKAVMDIEDCPIGTDAVRDGMRNERSRVTQGLQHFQNGATLLLRESTERKPTNESHDDEPADDHSHAVKDGTIDRGYSEVKTCVTHGGDMSIEFVDEYVFKQPAGLFFQNNNSILPRFTQYVREKCIGPGSSPPLTQLIDAYCGSGLFTVTLSSLFTSSIGIDIQPGVISGARQNAEVNKIENATFMTATASAIFDSLPESADPDRTAVVIDPPRKGCDADFLRQLLRFRPKRIVYVSCNCHTQARDVAVLVEGAGADARYELESLRGFDFFPQTSHVESVAVLQRVDAKEEDS